MKGIWCYVLLSVVICETSLFTYSSERITVGDALFTALFSPVMAPVAILGYSMEMMDFPIRKKSKQ